MVCLTRLILVLPLAQLVVGSWSFKTNLFSKFSSYLNSNNSDPLLSFGLEPFSFPDSSKKVSLKLENKISLDKLSSDDNETKSPQPTKDKVGDNFINPIDLKEVFENAVKLASQSHEEIQISGWLSVYVSDMVSVYKRFGPLLNVSPSSNIEEGGKRGPVEYLMTGRFKDSSPKTVFRCQVDKECRKLWDTTMKDLQCEEALARVFADLDSWEEKQHTPQTKQNQSQIQNQATVMSASRSEKEKEYEREGANGRIIGDEEVVYSRSSRWPMQDRDYCLTRR